MNALNIIENVLNIFLAALFLKYSVDAFNNHKKSNDKNNIMGYIIHGSLILLFSVTIVFLLICTIMEL